MLPGRAVGVVVAGLIMLATASATPTASAAAAAKPIDTTGATLYTFAAIEWCPNSTVISSWAGTRGGDITFGAFGRNGRVTGGDAVLVMRADLGTAPVTALNFPGTTDSATGKAMALTAGQPTASGTVNAAPGTNWNQVLAFQPELSTKSEGSGTAVVRFALLTRRNQSWRKAPGVTVDLNIIVGNCIGAAGGPTEWPLTTGGLS